MKNIYILLILCITSLSSFAQAPEKMSYQAIIRDNAGQLINNQSIGMRVSVLQGTANGSATYSETQSATTNANGLVSIEIGTGNVTVGTFSSIDWSNGPYFILVETDPTGAENYTIVGTSQLLSVPFALHAKTAETVINDAVEDADANPENEMNSSLVLNGTNLEITDAKGTLSADLSTLISQTTDADTDPTNEMNTAVVLNGTNLQVTDGNGTITTDLSSLVNDADADATNEMNTAVVLNGTNLQVTDGNGTITTDLSSLVNDADADATNEIQNISSVLTEGNDAGANSLLNLNQLAIGTTTPNPGAALEINSTTGAFLLPRMTTAERDAITAEIGMMIYNITEYKGQLYSVALETIDQQQTINFGEVTEGGQSFIAGTTGNWTKLRVVNSGAQTGTLNIYAGEGMGGSLIHSQSISVIGGFAETEIVLTSPVPIVSGQIYTFETDITISYTNDAAAYPNGTSYYQTGAITGDLVFKIIIRGSVWVDLH
ncbi:MAG: hypothetical protein ACI9XJ_002613 [Marivirga sp.]|jgi:hypothetical protein